MPSTAASIWSDIRAAIRGDEQDYTEAPLQRAILLLAIPMVLEMCMESLFGIVNIFWVARLGADAAAGVGLTESLMAIHYCVAMGVSMATTAMISRRIGEKDSSGAARSAAQAILLGIVFAVLIVVPSVWYAPDLLRLMGADSSVIRATSSYARVIFATGGSVMLLFVMNAVFRGAGNAAIAMRVLWAANLLNMVLDPLLIFGIGPFPRLGVEGAAWATLAGRTFGVLLQLRVLRSSSGRVHIRREHFRPDWRILRRLSGVSSTGMLQFLIAQASWVGLVRIIASSGAAALAGYTIAIRIVVFTLLPSWGLANAAATLVGQNLGARRPDRAETSVWRTGVYNMVFLGAVGLVFIVLPGPLVRFFTDDAVVVSYGVDCLRIISYGYPFYAYGMVLVQAFNGAGDTATPTWINLGVYWAFQLPLAWFLAHPLQLEALGAFWAVPVAEGALTIAGAYAFRRGRWKLRRI